MSMMTVSGISRVPVRSMFQLPIRGTFFTGMPLPSPSRCRLPAAHVEPDESVGAAMDASSRRDLQRCVVEQERDARPGRTRRVAPYCRSRAARRRSPDHGMPMTAVAGSRRVQERVGGVCALCGCRPRACRVADARRPWRCPQSDGVAPRQRHNAQLQDVRGARRRGAGETRFASCRRLSRSDETWSGGIKGHIDPRWSFSNDQCVHSCCCSVCCIV